MSALFIRSGREAIPVRGKSRAVLCAVSCVLACVAGQTAAVAQSICAQAVVTARGEPSRLAWAARAKARANWRARVRAMPGLGARYANWARASNAEERCIRGPAGSACTASAIPCRS